MNASVNPAKSIKHKSIGRVPSLRLLARRNHLVLMVKQFSRSHPHTDGKVDFGVRIAELGHIERELAKRGDLRVAVTNSGKLALANPPAGNTRHHYGLHERDK